MSKLNRWLQSTALTISLCSSTAFAEDVSQHLQRLYMWESIAKTCTQKAPKALEQDWKSREILLFTETKFWEVNITNKLRWLITSFRSINNIMPITIFIPALTTTLFYSD